ncbi:MAG: glycerol-3-phosphate dehydrogenase [Chloroflexota bacterium]|nr:glycerol-3-phosphate dehydrogenase [Chloroflexota bacterium]
MVGRRARALAEGREFDVVVIGAGINGAGIARDAAMRGLRVLLLDKADISSGTTSWSTRLIHGGLRYLEHREIGLVRESLREREKLLRIAPHLVKPLPLVIPIYKGDKRGPLLVRIGMLAYDLLSFDKSLESHRMLSHAEALEAVPGLNPEGLRAAAVYYDGQVEYAERLAVENAISAHNHGAVVLTYARVDKLVHEGGAIRGVEFTDLLNNTTCSVRAAVTINVAGPWMDEVLAGVAWPGEKMIGGTKGSHIIVNPFPGAPTDALYVEAREDQRPYFIVPWNDLYLIGTTDVRYSGDLDYVQADEDEIQYLIAETNRVIPQANLTRDEVLYTYSGIRPLPSQEFGREGEISRRHFIHDHAPELGGFISIVGGKLTTYRNLAEQTVDAVCSKLGRNPPRSRTARVALPGAVRLSTAFVERLQKRGPVSRLTAQHLQRTYGARALEVLDMAGDDPALLEVFSPETGAIGAEVLLALRRELAQTLADVLLRRTMVGIGPAVGVGADRAAAELACRYLGWDDARAAREVAEYREYIRRFHPRSLSEN